jgi:hypothetical protein
LAAADKHWIEKNKMKNNFLPPNINPLRGKFLVSQRAQGFRKGGKGLSKPVCTLCGPLRNLCALCDTIFVLKKYSLSNFV